MTDTVVEVDDAWWREFNFRGFNLMAASEWELEQRSTMFGRAISHDGRSDAELLREAVSVTSRSDVIVAALGEPSEMSGESSFRTELGIPGVRQNLLEALVKTGKPVVLLLFNGRPLTLDWEVANVSAILDVWFGSSETGDAVADVLFGDVNPSGKFTMTFPKNVGQIPLYRPSTPERGVVPEIPLRLSGRGQRPFVPLWIVICPFRLW